MFHLHVVDWEEYHSDYAEWFEGRIAWISRSKTKIKKNRADKNLCLPWYISKTSWYVTNVPMHDQNIYAVNVILTYYNAETTKRWND